MCGNLSYASWLANASLISQVYVYVYVYVCASYDSLKLIDRYVAKLEKDGLQNYFQVYINHR